MKVRTLNRVALGGIAVIGMGVALILADDAMRRPLVPVQIALHLTLAAGVVGLVALYLKTSRQRIAAYGADGELPMSSGRSRFLAFVALVLTLLLGFMLRLFMR